MPAPGTTLASRAAARAEARRLILWRPQETWARGKHAGDCTPGVFDKACIPQVITVQVGW
jgi:hypothetical protein